MEAVDLKKIRFGDLIEVDLGNERRIVEIHDVNLTQEGMKFFISLGEWIMPGQILRVIK